MITVFHELYHISPRFDGDIRRMGGRCHVHTHSQKAYDRYMEVFVDRFLSQWPESENSVFLKNKFRTLEAKYGGVIGLQMRIPKLVPLPESKSA